MRSNALCNSLSFEFLSFIHDSSVLSVALSIQLPAVRITSFPAALRQIPSLAAEVDAGLDSFLSVGQTGHQESYCLGRDEPSGSLDTHNTT